MSRLLLSNSLRSKCALTVLRESPVVARARPAPPRPGFVLSAVTQSRSFATSALSKARLKSRVWMYGVGVGFALVAFVKSSQDSASSLCDDQVNGTERKGRYRRAIAASRDLLERIKAEVGAPGMVVGVSVDGAQVWCEGIGYADLENRVPCTPETVMRVASISKPLTSAAAARLCENDKLDLDLPVQHYVPEFPLKQFDGQDVTITPRMILSHLSGIRHYEKDAKKVKEDQAKRLLKPQVKEKEEETNSHKKEDKSTEDGVDKGKAASQTQKKREFEHKEYYLKDNFESVIQALDLFKDDPLIFKPGTTFLYSTHAFTLLSAVMERAAGQRFLDLMMNMFHELGMVNTVAEENDPIIYHRSRFYHYNKKGRVVNCPYVDNSYKWAGGGFLSTVGDLLLFGNALLYSYQVGDLKHTRGLLPGFLRPETAFELWAPVQQTEASWDRDGRYAQGWGVVEKQQKYGQCRKRRHYVSHTGAAVGASSVLLVLPSEETRECQGETPSLPKGVVVTIITNMQSVGLNLTALKIAQEFDKATGIEV